MWTRACVRPTDRPIGTIPALAFDVTSGVRSESAGTFLGTLTGQRGISLVEVLCAVALLGIGLAGVGSALVPSGGVASAVTSGQSAVGRGYYVSTATMLAQDRLEQIKRLQYSVGPPAVDEITAPTPAGFENEGFGAIPQYPAFSRQVAVSAATPTATTKTVTVTVQFRVPNASGFMNVESVAVSTVIAAR
jgi:prepilin-type N-terminal cleavage/methylation domain-containing protein